MHITLQGMGFDVDEASTGEAALNLVRETAYDVVLIDINMPGMGESERAARYGPPAGGDPHADSAGHSEEDKVAALDAGADDYVTRPFKIRELAARIRAALGSSATFRVNPDAVIRIGNIELDPPRRLVRKGGEPLHLTPKEFDLLHYLMAHAGLPITMCAYCRRCGGRNTGELEYLRTFVRQLRKKLAEDPAEPD